MKLDGKAISFLGGLISAAFGAGAATTVWAAERPTRAEIAGALGCESKFDSCSVAKDAKEARLEVQKLAEDVKALRQDLNRNLANKKALSKFEAEIAAGVKPSEALQHVLEQDLP